jgi:ribosomal protein L1
MRLKIINEVKKKVNNSVRLKSKEPSLKIAIGKQSMKDEELVENILTIIMLF